MRTMIKAALASVALCALSALAVGCAAGVEPEPSEVVHVDTAQQGLSAYDVETVYYSDDTFTTIVGWTELYCGGTRHSTGTRSQWVYQSQDPCDGINTVTLQCMECVPAI